MKTLLDKIFPIPRDAIEPMIRREREMYWEEKEKADYLLEALKEIALGEGAYSQDRLTHAENVIENLMNIASKAIEEIEK